MISNFIGLYTIVRREIVRFMRIWTQTLLPSVVSAVLYFIIFGNLLGERIGSIQNCSYIEYVAPGLIMMAIVNTAYGNVASSFFLSKLQKNIEEMLVSPLSEHAILLGFIVGGIARGLLVGLLVACSSLFFIKFSIHHSLMFFGTTVLSVLLFSLAGFMNGIFSKNFDDINFVPAFILTPLIYLGGVFYSLESLPPFWRTINGYNPIFHMVNAFRFGMVGCSEANIYFTLGILGFLSLILYILNVYFLKKGIGIKS